MKKILLSAVFSVLLALAGAAQTAVIALKFALTGAQEVVPGDPDGTGVAMFIVDDVANSILWHITAQNIDPTSFVLIHQGPAGVSGPVVVNLNNTLDGMVIDAVADEIVQNPSQFYVNLFNSAHPAGAIRGQFAAAPANLAFQFPLSGAQEVVPGDPDGTGLATFIVDNTANSILWHITAQNIDPTSFVSIHQGPAGVSGPVVVNLNNMLDGVVIDADSDEIVQNPSQFYVNLFNSAHPAGAIRGQFVGQVVPEVPAPASLALVALGLLGIAGIRRRK